MVILGGAFGGTWLRSALPEQHLADDTKDVVRLGTGLIGTISALVLGLLIASANSSYNNHSGDVQHIAADVILLDQILALYGPEARLARVQLRQAIDPMVNRIWRENRSDTAYQASSGRDFIAIILQLTPQN